MQFDKTINEPLLGETKDKEEDKFSVDFFADMFQNQNINEGNSLKLYRQLTLNGFYKGVNSSPNGLDSKDAADIAKRTKRYGTNMRPKAEDKYFYEFVLESLEDPMLRILLAASIVSTIIGILQEGLATGWIEGFSIFLAVFVVVSISSFQNYSKDQQFKKLDAENSKKDIKVKRDGKEIVEISIDDLLVGDILHLNYGDIAPCDGILIKDSVVMDESAMTGESDLQTKVAVDSKFSEKVNPFIISGTQVMEGSGLVLALAVGSNKVSGKSDDIMDSDNDVTPLQQKLTVVAEKIGDLGLMAAIFIAFVLIAKDILVRYQKGQSLFSAYLLDSFVSAFIICITVIVVAIPEGLPMAVTISLAFSVFKMKEEHNLVRHLDASETMGNVNNVCTDKTGTITTGIMTLRSIWIEESVQATDKKMSWSESAKKLWVENVTNNISAYPETKDGKTIAKGNTTEVPLLKFMIDAGLQYVELKREKYFKQLPFNSTWKYMCTLVELDIGKYRLYIKGAPDRVLNFVTKVKAKDDKEVEYSKLSSDVSAVLDKFATDSMRTLAVAYRDFKDDTIESNTKDGLEFFTPLIKDLTLISILGIADAPRSDVLDSIRLCNEAGVTVRMVTGDNIKTAIAISQDVGIINPTEYSQAVQRIKAVEQGDKGGLTMPTKIIALEGLQFKELSGGYAKLDDGFDSKGKQKFKYELNNVDKFKKTTENLKVIARASPDDKFLLVLGLKQIGNIVAVTGDGTNDAPAMKKSDVGFAMGQRGTDIAKNASDIVLLNDAFSSIVTAIKYGRNVYDCIRKFLQFQLTCNVVAVFMTLIGGVVLNDSPLNPIQMLWVNLIMDSFASLALATEPPNDSLLKRKPYSKDTDIITPTMKINIVAQSAFQIVVLIFIIYYGDILFGVPSDRELNHFTWNNHNGYHFTIFFNIFVFLQVFNSINARKLLRTELNVFENIFNNYLYILIQFIIIAGQLTMVTFGGRALRTHPLTVNQHLGCLGIAALSLPVGLLIKLLPIGIDEHVEGVSGFSISKSMRGRKSAPTGGLKLAKSIKM